MNNTTQDELTTLDADDEFMNRERDWSKARRKPEKVIPRRAQVNRIHPMTATDAIGYAVCLSHSGYTKSLIPFKILTLRSRAIDESEFYSLAVSFRGRKEGLQSRRNVRLRKVSKIYPVLPDESAAKSGWIRIIDEEDVDMLYKAEDFVAIELPNAVEDAFKHLERAA